MSVPFAYIGLRQLNSKIKTKIPGKFASKIIIAAGVFVLVYGFLAGERCFTVTGRKRH